tara:strand:+ start:432 stop:1064 length:633 start_codon:yes stop_codon:yes gene_type:complete
MKKIENIRINYDLDNLDLDKLNPHPMIQFDIWFSQLSQNGDFNAVTLSTYNKVNGVRSRVVLLKDFDKTGFVFYTNYNSLKARQIIDNNNVSLCFFWPDFQRQVRVNGFVEKLSARKSDLYFKKRPRKSQISAWASNQSSQLLSREKMISRYNIFEKKFLNKTIPRPDFWGGFHIKPNSVEFWQGGVNRMHDRFLYEKKKSVWKINRLSP